MVKIGIFFGSSTGNAEFIADRIQAEFGEALADVHNIDAAEKKELEQYKYLIFGTSTWGLGDLQDDWDDFSEELKEVDLSKKKIAFFGLGDQEVYAHSFVNGMGHLYDLVSKRTNVVGEWPTTNYRYQHSNAIRNGKFVGLAIDYDNDKAKTEKLIQQWVKILKKEFR